MKIETTTGTLTFALNDKFTMGDTVRFQKAAETSNVSEMLTSVEPFICEAIDQNGNAVLVSEALQLVPFKEFRGFIEWVTGSFKDIAESAKKKPDSSGSTGTTLPIL